MDWLIREQSPAAIQPSSIGMTMTTTPFEFASTEATFLQQFAEDKLTELNTTTDRSSLEAMSDALFMLLAVHDPEAWERVKKVMNRGLKMCIDSIDNVKPWDYSEDEVAQAVSCMFYLGLMQKWAPQVDVTFAEYESEGAEKH
jgi:hypothetical protein